MQPRAGAPDLAGDHGQRDEAARIVGAVHMLADAHAPENQRGAGFGIEPRDNFDLLRRDAAESRHFLRREIDDALLQPLKPLRIARDILRVGQALGDDRVQHGVEQRHIAPRLESEVMRGVA